MLIKKYKLFLENKEKINVEDVYLFFMDIVDMKDEYYKIRSSNADFKKIFDIKYSLTRSGNFVIHIFCDNLYPYYIMDKIKEDIKPRLESYGYKIVSIKNIKTDKTIRKELPVSGRDETATVFDPMHRIEVTVKKLI